MSDFEMLLTAWLQGGTIPADFKPTSNVEEYLLAILNGVDDDVDPKSRADVLLDAIATKYAGYADGLEELRGVTGMTAHHVPGGDTPEEVAAFLRAINTTALQDLAAKGATGVANNTTDILWAYEDLPSGASLNIAYGDTAPEDTTKLWVKTAQPQNVTVDYDINNGVESIETLTTVLPNAAWAMGIGTVGKKCYLFGGWGGGTMNTINVFDTETNAITTLPTALPNAASAIGCGVVGTKIYLFGGNYGGFLNTINVFDTETNTISTLSSVTLPTASSHMACGVVGTKCYLFGGNSSNGKLNAIWVFDAATNTITALAATIPSATSSIACGVVGTKVYLFGGLGNAIAVFDTETEICTTLSTTLPIAASAIACGVVGANCYLFGGNAGSSNLNTIDKFTVTFPLNEGDVYLQSDVFKNKFTLVTAPTEVKTGVSVVYVGNASNEAEYAEAYLHDGTGWQPIT